MKVEKRGDKYFVVNGETVLSQGFNSEAEAQTELERLKTEEGVSAELSEVVKEEGGKWFVFSEDGKKLSKGFDSEEEAKARLAEIEAFKQDATKAEEGAHPGTKKKKPVVESKFEGRLIEGAPLDNEGRHWLAIILECGPSKNTVTDPRTGEEKPRLYGPAAVQAAVDAGLFEGRAAIAVEIMKGTEFVFDHLPDGLDANKFPKNSGGVFHKTSFDESIGIHGGAAVGTFSFIDDDLRKKNLAHFEATGKPLVGFSINAIGEGDFTESNFEIETITECATIDAVSKPAAGGRLVQKLAASLKESVVRLREARERRSFMFKKWMKFLAAHIALAGLKSDPAKKLSESEAPEKIKEAEAMELLKALIADPEAAPHKDTLEEILKAMMASRAEQGAGEAPPAETPPTEPEKKPEESKEGKTEESEEKTMTEAEMKSWFDKQMEDQKARAAVVTFISEEMKKRDLPESAKALLDPMIEKAPADMANAKKAVDTLCESLGNGGWEPTKITVTKESEDKRKEYLEKALEGGLQGRSVDGIRPLRSIKEAVSRVTGIARPDFKLRSGVISHAMRLACAQLNSHGRGLELDAYEASVEAGLRESQTVGLKQGLMSRYRVKTQESIDTTVFTSVFAAVLFKRMIEKVKRLQQNDWQQLVSDEFELEDFRTQTSVRTGRYPLLAKVAEGQPFQPIVTPGDEEVLWNATKFGNTEDWTLESALADDLKHTARIPEDLLEAALETRRKNFWAQLTDQAFTGQDIFDSTPLFTAGHKNIASLAFGFDNLDAIDVKARQQLPFDGADQELGEANKIAWIVVVTNIKKDARKVVMSDNRPGEGQEGIDNEFKGVKMIILDHLATGSTTFWVGVADPAKTNTAYFGTVQGFELPVLTINDQENQGPRFFEDKTTIKVEDAHAHVIPDFRPWQRGNA